ncbi:hypothetical protein [Paenibacillus sinopodophylli]|uniref:hypothetical protein n=1 Tax=Paenibacillus sinopodophylli TaxID=1837342 RepID=UPI00110D1642|nr:hypothetical protein [Paenibacillus sinopodophylli]
MKLSKLLIVGLMVISIAVVFLIFNRLREDEMNFKEAIHTIKARISENESFTRKEAEKLNRFFDKSSGEYRRIIIKDSLANIYVKYLLEQMRMESKDLQLMIKEIEGLEESLNKTQE